MSLDTRVTETEKSSDFSAAECEANKNELNAAKEELKTFRKNVAI